jgi:hypothetical protein
LQETPEDTIEALSNSVLSSKHASTIARRITANSSSLRGTLTAAALTPHHAPGPHVALAERLYRLKLDTMLHAANASVFRCGKCERLFSSAKMSVLHCAHPTRCGSSMFDVELQRKSFAAASKCS